MRSVPFALALMPYADAHGISPARIASSVRLVSWRSSLLAFAPWNAHINSFLFGLGVFTAPRFLTFFATTALLFKEGALRAQSPLRANHPYRLWLDEEFRYAVVARIGSALRSIEITERRPNH